MPEGSLQDLIADEPASAYLRRHIESSHSKPTETQLADLLAVFLRSREHAVSVNSVLWRYDASQGVYVVLQDSEVRNELYNLDGCHNQRHEAFDINNAKANRVLRIVKDRLTDDDFFDGAAVGIAVENGFLEVSGCEINFTDTSPAQRTRKRTRLTFDEASNVDEIDAIVYDILEDDDKARLFYEIAGATLLGIGARFHTAIIFYGKGANGKGVLTSLLQALVPDDLRASVSPDEWKLEYLRLGLVGKHLNTVAEMPAFTRQSFDVFKALSAGDRVSARSVRGNIFEFKPIALHVFSTNALPALPQFGEAVDRRFLVVPFDRTIPPQSRIVGLAEQTIRRGGNGFLLRAVEGARRLLQQGRFSRPASAELATRRWLDGNNPAAIFAKLRLERTQNRADRISATDMEGHCADFCAEKGMIPPGKHRIKQELEALGYEQVKQSSMYWVCVRLRE